MFESLSELVCSSNHSWPLLLHTGLSVSGLQDQNNDHKEAEKPPKSADSYASKHHLDSFNPIISVDYLKFEDLCRLQADKIPEQRAHFQPV